MSKKLYLLVVFVLVLGLGGLVQAGTDVNIINPSFELDNDGNQKICGSDTDDMLGWEGGGGFTGSSCDSSQPEACDDCWDHDDTTGFPDGYLIGWVQGSGASMWQFLDINDSNTTITAGRQYMLSWYGLGWWDNALKVELYYPEDANYPDANIVEVASLTQDLEQPGATPWDFFPGQLKFVVEAGYAGIGKKLGIRFTGVTGDSDDYVFFDDIHLTWEYATYAYNPYPADGEVDVSRDVVLNWKASSWAQSTDGHDVYFGTDYNSVRDANESSDEYMGSFDLDVNYCDPCSGQLNLGQVCYWRVDEVNDAYTAGWEPGDDPPAGPWVGEVWSFEVTGHATNPSPEDGEVDIPFLNLTLSWDAATSATSYDVYFGTDFNSVRDANDSGSPGPTEIYRSHQSGLSYVVPESLTTGLDVGGIYYWRIDPVGGADLTGHIWSFTIGEFLIVDDMESYIKYINDIDETWDCYNDSGAEVYLIYNEPNHMRSLDSQSMELIYDNTKSGSTCDSSYIDANPADLVIGTDWTVGGVKSITLFWLGDPDNEIPTPTDYNAVRLWFELEDTSANSYLVKYGGFGENLINIQVADWHQWHISLLEYENAGVNLASLARVTIGIGGTDYTGQSRPSEGTIWIDDIRLYPPRCRPEVSVQTGDFTEDCTVDSYDLDIMATDWLLTDGNNPTENQPATLTGFPDATSHWITDSAVGTGAIDINEGYNIDVNDPRLNGLASMSITAWVKQTIDNEWVGIVSSREDVGCGDDATELGIYGSEWGGPDGLGYDWSCGDEEWEWNAGLIVPSDGTWTFIAMSVDPIGCTLYMRPASSALQTGLRNVGEHPLQQNFSEGFTIGNDDKEEASYFAGAIDDVRIYAYALDFNDVNNLAYQTAEPDPAPVYRYEFEETTGYTAADSGTPTILYSPVASVANLADPEPKLERAVNLVDYAILADSWLEEYLWPY